MMLVAASWEEQLQEQSPLKLSASCFDVVFANAMLENERISIEDQHSGLHMWCIIPCTYCKCTGCLNTCLASMHRLGAVFPHQHAGTHWHSVCSHAHTSPRVPWPQGVHTLASAAVQWPQGCGDLHECNPHPGAWGSGTYTRIWDPQGSGGAEDSRQWS